MANHHLTGRLVNSPLSIMPAHAAPLFMPAQTSLCVMPAQAGIQSTPTVVPAKAGHLGISPTPTATSTVMPAKAGIQELSLTVMPAEAGIHSSRTEHWIPACAGMTTGECVDPFDAARREAARLAADADDMEALENAERQLEGTGLGKKK